MKIRPLTYLLGAGLLAVSNMAAQDSKPQQTSEIFETRGDFTLTKVNDSLYWLRSTESRMLPKERKNDWQLPYPVYQFQTGDVDGDGNEDAMVGVIKSTRFYPEKARRLFIFKLVNKKVRPLWLGSKLGGILEDFRFVDGKIRALESTTDSLFVVSDYKWDKFGMAFDHFIIKGVDQETAIKTFSQ